MTYLKAANSSVIFSFLVLLINTIPINYYKMKISTTLSIAALLASAQAAVSSVKLFVESDNTEINGNGLSGRHEGAGISVVFLGGSGSDSDKLTYDSEEESLYFTVNDNIRYSFSIYENAAIEGVLPAYKVSFDEDYLKVNGTADGFFACKNIAFDPYSYSKSSYALTNYVGSDAPKDCIPLKIKKQDA